MRQNSTTSYWTKSFAVPSFNSLKKNMSADVCIVGAGIAGLTCAYLLQLAGKSVIVLDKGELCGGQTSRTTAHLCTVLDDRYYHLEFLFPDYIKDIARGHVSAVDMVEKIIKKEKIDCDFQRIDGYLILAEEHTQEELKKELKAIKRIGAPKVKKVARAPFHSFDTGECLKFPGQAEFHPLKYLSKLAEIFVKRGGKIFTHTKIIDFEDKPTVRVLTEDGYKIISGSLIVATNTPINDRFVMHTKQAPFRTYVIGCAIPKGAVPQLLCWDTGYPYHYIRVVPSLKNKKKDILLIGGEDHKTGQRKNPETLFHKLENWARARFPFITNIEFKWSGQVLEPVDGIAFIGRNPCDNPNVYIATGDSGNGLTHGTLAGMILHDLILEIPNPLEVPYAPDRINLRSIKKFTKENANVALQYAKWGKPETFETEKSLRKIKPGTGCLVQDGIKKHAVYRDEDGKLFEFSALCPHLGGPIQWNSLEKTWDCPCHGSRFDRYGKVIDGPAINNLTREKNHKTKSKK